VRPPRTRRYIVRGILVVLLLLLILVLGFVIARVVVPGYQGYQGAQALRTLAADGLEPDDAAQIEAAIAQIHGSVQELARGTQPVNPLLRALGGVTSYGGTIAETPELLQFGRAYTALANEVAPLLGSALSDGTTLERGAALAVALGSDPERLERMVTHAEAGAAAYVEIDADDLIPALADRFVAAGPLVAALPKLLPALPGLPTLLGMEEPHTLLVLVQNNNELRPTGGFITAVGRVTLDKGQIAEMDFQDSYAVFRYDAIGDYPTAPLPLQKYMQIPYISFRDSNWSPDLPTTAAIARVIYSADTGAGFDDLVTLDLDAAQTLIAALSPIKLTGVDEPITGDNIIEIMRELWAQPPDSDVSITEDLGKWWRERKDFIPKLAQAVLDKVLNGQADPIALGVAALETLDQRSIQLAMQDETLAGVFAAQGWDGALTPPDEGDFLAIVDTNMGFNKVDAVMTRGLAYTVTWPTAAGEAPLAVASVTYTHTFAGPANQCEPKPLYGQTYSDMIERCYFSYVRLYTPAGSTLVGIAGVNADSIESQRGEKGTQVFSGYLKVEPDESKTVTFTYRLPQTVTPAEYTLRIQRQSGTGPLPVQLDIGGVRDGFVLTDGRVDWAPPKPAN
jgi:hypothetical protein